MGLELILVLSGMLGLILKPSKAWLIWLWYIIPIIKLKPLNLWNFQLQGIL